MAVLPKDNVKVSVSGNYLQVAYDFVRIEQKEEDASDSMHMVVLHTREFVITITLLVLKCAVILLMMYGTLIMLQLIIQLLLQSILWRSIILILIM